MKKLMPFLALILAVCDVGAQTQIDVHGYCPGGSSADVEISVTLTENLYLSNSSTELGSTTTGLSQLSNSGDIIFVQGATLESLSESTLYAYRADGSSELDSLMYSFDFTYSVTPEICLVSVNPNEGWIEIEIDSSSTIGHDTMYIEVQTGPNEWTRVDTLSSQSGELLAIHETNITLVSYTYRAVGVYGCTQGVSHTNIYLEKNGGSLEWEDYVGTAVNGYDVYKWNGSQWEQFTFTTGNNFNDNSYVVGDEYYIEASRVDGPCNVSSWARMSSSAGAIRSNITGTPNSISEGTISESDIRMVNPSHELNLTLPSKMDVDVFTLSGQRVHTYSNTEYVNDNTYQSGMYLVVIHDDKTRLTQRLMITH